MRNELSWNIIKKFSSDDLDCFSYQDVVKEYSSIDKIYLSKVLSRMVDNGMLIKLSRGLYYIVPTNADAENYIPDWHLVAKYIMKGRKYYIGYYSAMQVHNLITQPGLKEIIVTDHQFTSSSRNIQGIEFQFVTHISKRFFGYKNTWINQHNKAMVSDLEKTIVDAVTRPHLCGGMVEVGKAIYEARERVSLDKLLNYLIKNESQAAIKRYLFICELVDINWTSYHEGMLQKKGNSYSLLDTSAPNQGSKNSKFGLKINVDVDTIKNSIYT